MRPEKEEIEKRKKELQKQHDDLMVKINQGKEAIKSMETNLIGLQGAIQQCNWTLELYKEEKDK
jgi:chromosome segregation ATPase